MRGRKPKPTALKMIQGNPGRRPFNDKEPQPDISIPEAPEGLSKIGKAEWSRITAQLYSMNMIAEMDLAIVLGYCHSFEQFIKSAKELSNTGYLIKAPSGYSMLNPLLSINNEAKRQMLKFAQELGLSSVQRSRMKIDKPIEVDALDSFIGKG